MLCGGKHAGANRTSACDVLELGALAWRQPSLNLHAARSMIAAVTLGTKIFFAGGELAENRSAPAVAECSDMVDVLDVTTMTWGPVLRLSQPRKKLAAAVSGQFVVFAGGYLSGLETSIQWTFGTPRLDSGPRLSTSPFRGFGCRPQRLPIGHCTIHWPCSSRGKAATGPALLPTYLMAIWSDPLVRAAAGRSQIFPRGGTSSPQERCPTRWDLQSCLPEERCRCQKGSICTSYQSLTRRPGNGPILSGSSSPLRDITLQWHQPAGKPFSQEVFRWIGRGSSALLKKSYLAWHDFVCGIRSLLACAPAHLICTVCCYLPLHPS